MIVDNLVALEGVRLGALILGFLAVSLGTYALMTVISGARADWLTREQPRGWLDHISHRLGRRVASWNVFSGLLPAVRQSLSRLGDRRSADDFLGRCLTWAGAGAVFAAALGATFFGSFGVVGLILVVSVVALTAFYLPIFDLRSCSERRLKQIQRRLPYALDMQILAMQAGAGFDGALELQIGLAPEEPLNQELAQARRDRELGKSQRDALAGMAQRIASDDLSSLVAALDLGEELGTPLAETLRKQADELRLRRTQRAEKLAQEARPKMALPSTLIMMANVLLILSPFFIKLSQGELF